MDTLLRSLIFEWDHINKLRDKMFEDMPEYQETQSALACAARELEDVLTPEAQKLFDLYENARTASAALESTASILCGAHICLRLLVTLL